MNNPTPHVDGVWNNNPLLQGHGDYEDYRLEPRQTMTNDSTYLKIVKKGGTKPKIREIINRIGTLFLNVVCVEDQTIVL